MDPEDLKAVLRTTGVDLWSLIDTAITVAAAEHGREFKMRRGVIVEKLYTVVDGRCQNCDGEMATVAQTKGSSSNAEKRRRSVSPMQPPMKRSGDEDDEREDEYVDDVEEVGLHRGAIDDEKSKILAIKDFLDDADQSEDSLLSLLQNLADMDITFKALKETDIGRHVNGLRKHPSSEVKRLVKQLVRKWKETVDEWVKLNSANDTSSPAIITDGDSPQPIPVKHSNQNGHQTTDFTYSPNPHTQNGMWQSERNGFESVEPPKARPAPRRETPPSKPPNSTPFAAATPKVKEKDSLLDPDRLASARKRLHENYQEAQNARKQRTIQVMDIHDIPKPKNAFFARNKGGFQAKH